jgi:hypothetical protein
MKPSRKKTQKGSDDNDSRSSSGIRDKVQELG